MALQVFTTLRCEGLARVDFFFEENGRGFLCNEVNTMPGLHADLDVPEVVDRQRPVVSATSSTSWCSWRSNATAGNAATPH